MQLTKPNTIEIATISASTSASSSLGTGLKSPQSHGKISSNKSASSGTPTNSLNTNATAATTSSTSWLLRFFESKHFDMSIAISYLFNTKEPGVQTYLCNRLFTFSNKDVDFYLPQLLNIYIYCCSDNNEQLIADMLNAYFRARCSCRQNGIDFSIRCSWLLDAHINDNAKLATRTKESTRIRRGLNNAIKLYRLIINERLRPLTASNTESKFSSHTANATKLNGGECAKKCQTKSETSEAAALTSQNTGGGKTNANSNLIMTSLVKEESLNDIVSSNNGVTVVVESLKTSELQTVVGNDLADALIVDQ